MYLKYNNVVSVADNCIYNVNTKKWILNETKYGVYNTLRKNQAVIDEGIRAGGLIEIRSVKKETLENLENIGKAPGSQIRFDKILRSNSSNGIISSQTIKQVYP